MLAPERILVVSQGPHRQPFIQEMIYLFKTLRIFGGALSKSQKIACFTEPISSETTEKLNQLGVITKKIDSIDNRCVHANKIQNLSFYNDKDFDLLISLDTDIIIANDFSKYIDESVICAKPVDRDVLNLDQWKQLFHYFDLELPVERYITSFDYLHTIPYFNSGVLSIPRKYIPSLYESWKLFVKKLLESCEKLDYVATNSFFIDQFALSLALSQNKIPSKPLPLEMNFPTHFMIHENFKPQIINPYLIHYHHKLSDGNIMHCTYNNVNLILDKINHVIHSPDIK